MCVYIFFSVRKLYGFIRRNKIVLKNDTNKIHVNATPTVNYSDTGYIVRETYVFKGLRVKFFFTRARGDIRFFFFYRLYRELLAAACSNSETNLVVMRSATARTLNDKNLFLLRRKSLKFTVHVRAHIYLPRIYIRCEPMIVSLF